MQRGSSLAVLLAAALLASGCGAHRSYRQGQSEAKKGNWDLAVARLEKALQQDPDNVGYKIALENARIEASRLHQDQARKALAADDLDKAAEELAIATNYDTTNRSAAEDLLLVKDRIRRREDERRRLAEFEARGQSQAVRLPVPVLSPRSTAPIIFNFTEQSLEKVFEALGKVAGVNILFDPDFRDKRVSVRLTGVSFQEALDQLTLQNRLFYKVLDRNTLIIVPESAAKRRSYDDLFLRTFYIQNAEVKEVETLVKTALGGQVTVVTNPTLGAINVIATPDQIAVAERLIGNNDKARGEVIVEVEILEVNRNKVKEYGLALSNYSAGVTLSPTGAPGEVTASGLTNVRAHLLSSLNLSDFIVQIPASVLTRFLQTDDSVRILASPKLRAAEGKKTALKIGQEVPIPVTTFTSAAPGQVGGATFAPATSFQYRNVGVNLELTPKVSPGGEIFLEMAVEFSLLGQPTTLAGTELPTFLTRNVNGVLRLRDGEPVLLGGLLQDRETQSFTSALGLQNIPIINKLLPSSRKVVESSELLMSITPHLVRAPKVLAGDLEAMAVGTKENYRVGGARPTLFGPEDVTASPPPAAGAAPAPRATPPAPPTGPTTGRPPGTVAPGLPPAGEQTTPAAPTPAPQVVPTPIPPVQTVPTPVPPPVEPPPVQQAAPPEVSPVTPPGAAPPAPVAPVLVQLSPPTASFAAGQSTSLSIILVNVQDVQSVEFVIGFDPTIIEGVEVAAGTLLTLDGASVGVERSVEPGRVRARLTRQVGVSGSGIAAVVTFRGVGAGTTAVGVEAVTLSSSVGAIPARVAAPSRLTVAGAR